MKHGYLFYFCDGIGSVFDSQVLALLKGIKEKDQFKKIILFLGIRNENQRNDFIKREATLGIEIVFFKAFPNYPFFNRLNRKSIKNAVLSQRINLKEAIFHTRGEILAWHLSKVLESEYHKNIFPDVRGASVEEIEEFSDLSQILKSLKVTNNKKAIRNLNRFNRVFVVSDSLKRYLITNYRINAEKIDVIHCLADEGFKLNRDKREKIRRELNLSLNDMLIVYSSGGTANWQNNDVLIRLAENGLKVLNLSKKEIPHTNILNKFVSYSEMPWYLNAADVAIIWRDKSEVNKVASPVKFSEYICCGLPLIANNSVDMIIDYITWHDCGVLIDSLDYIDLSSLNNLKQKDRNKISESGILNFGIEAITNKYLLTYSPISNL